MDLTKRDIGFTSHDGLELYAADYGPSDARLTALCMHGLTRNHKDFEPMIAALDRSDVRFISVDVRGRGQSAHDPKPENYSPVTYVQDMATLLDLLGLPHVVLIGTSMGGLMSMLMMRNMSARIAGVVMNDVGPTLEKAGLARIGGYVGAVEPMESWEAAAAAVEQVQSPAFPGKERDFWMAFARRTFREQPDGRVILDYDPAISASLGKVKVGTLTRFMTWRVYGAMKARPLLIVRGGASDLFSAKTAARMIRRHPDAREAVVPNVGHAPILDEPEAVQAINSFLDRLMAA